MRSITGLFVALCAVAACSEAGSDGWTVTEQKSSGGFAHVVNVPPATGIEPTWVVEPEVRIGAVEGTDPDVFGQIKGLAVDGQGRIFVLDASAQELRVFGADGAHLRTLGKKGAGPGEFDDANGMVIGRDDVVRVNDPRNQRISRFHADSGFIGSFPVIVNSFGWIWNGVIDSALVTWESTLIARDSGYVQGVRGHDNEGRWTDTILYEPLDLNRSYPGVYSWRTARGGGSMQVPFWPMGQQVMDPRGFIWRKGATNDYRVAQTTLQGDTLLIIEAQRPLVTVSQQERDSAIAEVRETAGQQDWSKIPTHKPVITQVFNSDDGDVWVRVETGDDTKTTYDVFGDNGRYKGTAVINGRADRWLKPVVRAGRYWAVVRDDLDVAYVVSGKLNAAKN